MTKKILFIFFILALTLVACTTNEPTPTQETTVEVADTPSPRPPQPTATATKVQLSGDGSLMACNVVSLLPPIDPTQAAVFPPVSEDEWTQGAEDARVTIVEYADFQ
jgi:protein-disulfide isomerase